MRLIGILIFIVLIFELSAQEESEGDKKLAFTGDFRFRLEHDWNSRNSLGVFREDRSRMRYRFRFGSSYSFDSHSLFGARVRTGNLNDQQGPHVTLGGPGEFSLVSLGFEKLYYKYSIHSFSTWIGKNSRPFKTINELFWNDNVYPEGIALTQRLILHNWPIIDSVFINAGHFVINSQNATFNKDSYLQVIQLEFDLFNSRVNLFPGYYYFGQVGNYPDGKETFLSTMEFCILDLLFN